jgi:hypothetical protein
MESIKKLKNNEEITAKKENLRGQPPAEATTEQNTERTNQQ